jgi:multiple sugar transport system substrate-binding protein
MGLTPSFALCYAFRMRRVAVIFLFFVLGCGTDSNTTVLRVWDWWSPVEGEAMREYFRVVEETFERQHPGVDLRFQHIPFGPQYIQKIMAGMAAGRPPDVLHSSIIWANDLYERGVLSDLRPFVERSPDMADEVWLRAALRYGRDGDYIYGIPIEHDASDIIYNLDLFEEAGISTDPFALETWDDLRQAALRLTKRDQQGRVVQAGFMVPAGNVSNILPWMYSNGGQFYAPDTRHAAFNSPEMIEAMQFLQDLQYKDQVSFPLATERQDFQLFLQGKVAMFMNGTWAGHIIEEQAPNIRFQMTSFPRGPRGAQRGGMTWTNLMCVPKGAGNPELAWEFIRYYCGMRNAKWKLKSIDRNSPLAGFYETEEWREAVAESPSLEMVPHITEVGGLYPVVRYTEIEEIFRPLSDGLMLNTLTPQDVLDKAEVKVNAVLDRYYDELQEAYR